MFQNNSFNNRGKGGPFGQQQQFNSQQQEQREPQTVEEWKKAYKPFTEQFSQKEREAEFERIRQRTKESQNCIPIVMEWHPYSKNLLPLKKRKFLVQNDVKLEEFYQQARQLLQQSNHYRNCGNILFFVNKEVLDMTNTQLGKIYDEKKSMDDEILYFVYTDNKKAFEDEEKYKQEQEKLIKKQ